MRLRLPLLLALTLTACQSLPSPKAAPPATEVAAPATVIHGVASCPGAPAAGTRLEVQWIDDLGTTIAQQSVEEANGSRWAFELSSDAAKIDPARRYALRATVRSASGRLQCMTESRVPVTPGATQRIELGLLRVARP